jgi:catalase
MNVAPELAAAVATGLGIAKMPAPMPKVLEKDVTPEVTESPTLSLFARPGDGSIRARRVAIFVADGVKSQALTDLASQLTAGGAVPRFVGSRLGRVAVGGDSAALEVDASFEATPSVLFDAVVLPDGAEAVRALAADGRAVEFVKDQYRHCKPILILGAASALIEKAGIPMALPSGKRDPGLISVKPDGAGEGAADFIKALGSHRQFARETDPPRV